MDHYSRILFPINKDDISLEDAIRFAKAHGAHLTILYTYRLDISHLAANQQQRSIKNMSEEAVRTEFENRNIRTLKDSNVDFSIQYELGFLLDRLKVCLSQSDFDLLLLSGYDYDGERLSQNDIDALNIAVQVIKN